jgi:hypothetical protein
VSNPQLLSPGPAPSHTNEHSSQINPPSIAIDRRYKEQQMFKIAFKPYHYPVRRDLLERVSEPVMPDQSPNYQKILKMKEERNVLRVQALQRKLLLCQHYRSRFGIWLADSDLVILSESEVLIKLHRKYQK